MSRDKKQCSKAGLYRMGFMAPYFFSRSFMPHLGQSPGLSCTTSGCIEQVYFTFFASFGAPLVAVLSLDPVQPVMSGVRIPSVATMAKAAIR